MSLASHIGGPPPYLIAASGGQLPTPLNGVVNGDPGTEEPCVTESTVTPHRLNMRDAMWTVSPDGIPPQDVQTLQEGKAIPDAVLLLVGNVARLIRP